MSQVLISIVICLMSLVIYASSLSWLVASRYGRSALPSSLRWLVHPTQVPGRRRVGVTALILSTVPQLFLLDLVRRAEQWNAATVAAAGEIVVAAAWSVYVAAVWIGRSRNSLV